ncbi:unnamed protein product, partial [Ectocarpus sp. 4 AP-2014]
LLTCPDFWSPSFFPSAKNRRNLCSTPMPPLICLSRILESIFSFIFGDGDPNADMNQRRVEAAATLIRGNGGAVSAEQLAPLLTPETLRSSDSSVVDESFVLPILTALDGAPEVTEEDEGG